MLSKDELISALQLRYDPYSAEAVFTMARHKAELAEKPTYDAKELAELRAAIAVVGERVDRVLEELDRRLDAASPPPAPAAEPQGKTKTKKEAKNAAKVEDKPQASPAKGDDPASGPDAGDGQAANDVVETTIVLTGVDADDTDEVLLCGASELLGDWDPARAQPMARTGDQWVATIRVAPGAELAFKFLRRTADGGVIWETGEDRKLAAKPRMEASWR